MEWVGVGLSQDIVARILPLVNTKVRVLVLYLHLDRGQDNQDGDRQGTKVAGDELREGLLQEVERAVPG